MVSPPLTTVRIKQREMGIEAARLLLARMAGQESVADILLRPELVQRRSTDIPQIPICDASVELKREEFVVLIAVQAAKIATTRSSHTYMEITPAFFMNVRNVRRRFRASSDECRHFRVRGLGLTIRPSRVDWRNSPRRRSRLRLREITPSLACIRPRSARLMPPACQNVQARRGKGGGR